MLFKTSTSRQSQYAPENFKQLQDVTKHSNCQAKKDLWTFTPHLDSMKIYSLHRQKFDEHQHTTGSKK